jgi:nitrate reductase NapD
VQDFTPASPASRPGSSDEQWHVAGILVHVAPLRADEVKAFIDRLADACVHGEAEGKLVVTLEAASTAALLDQLDLLRAQPGVLSALPVYQHNEPAADIDPKEAYGH